MSTQQCQLHMYVDFHLIHIVYTYTSTSNRLCTIVQSTPAHQPSTSKRLSRVPFNTSQHLNNTLRQSTPITLHLSILCTSATRVHNASVHARQDLVCIYQQMPTHHNRSCTTHAPYAVINLSLAYAYAQHNAAIYLYISVHDQVCISLCNVSLHIHNMSLQGCLGQCV